MTQQQEEQEQDNRVLGVRICIQISRTFLSLQNCQPIIFGSTSSNQLLALRSLSHYWQNSPPRREKCNKKLYKKIHLKLVSSGIIIGGTKVGLPWLVGSCTTSRFSCSILTNLAPSWTMHPEPQLQSVQNKLYTGEGVTSLQRFTFQF